MFGGALICKNNYIMIRISILGNKCVKLIFVIVAIEANYFVFVNGIEIKLSEISISIKIPNIPGNSYLAIEPL